MYNLKNTHTFIQTRTVTHTVHKVTQTRTFLHIHLPEIGLHKGQKQAWRQVIGSCRGRQRDEEADLVQEVIVARECGKRLSRSLGKPDVAKLALPMCSGIFNWGSGRRGEKRDVLAFVLPETVKSRRHTHTHKEKAQYKRDRLSLECYHKQAWVCTTVASVR